MCVCINKTAIRVVGESFRALRRLRNDLGSVRSITPRMSREKVTLRPGGEPRENNKCVVVARNRTPNIAMWWCSVALDEKIELEVHVQAH